MSDNENERIAKLETKLEIELSAIKEVLLDLKNMFISREENYVSKSVFEAELKLRDRELENTNKRIDQIEADKQSNKQLLPNWIQAFLAVGGVITAIIALFK